MGRPPSGEQVEAWRGEYTVLTAALRDIVASAPRAREWAAIFEYELPRERGRRPDVVILTGSQVIVLEFKESATLLKAHVDQVAAYARDLRHYHVASHDKLVDPVLVLTRSPVESHGVVRWQSPQIGSDPGAESDFEDVAVVNLQGLRGIIAELERRAPGEPVDAEGWLNADYSPLPSLVSAARRIFEHEPLPQIKKAQSAGIPDTIATLVAAANEAREQQEVHLALIAGVPRSGKTLVELQFVYENHFGDTGSRRSAVFLSGNGSLVDVLQYALKSKVFVQDVHGFLKQYGGESSRLPEEHTWVYDETQRAWDAQRVREDGAGQVRRCEALMMEGNGTSSGGSCWHDRAEAKTPDSRTEH